MKPDLERHEVIAIDNSKLSEIASNNHLAEIASGETSQSGEEGVLRHVLGELGCGPGWCVEFGACDGIQHSNIYSLIKESGWSGVYIETDPHWVPLLSENFKNVHNVHCINARVGWEGEEKLDEILSKTPLPTDFDLLVIDIDSNDAHVWRAMEKYRPKVVMIEFNPYIPPDVVFIQERRHGVVHGSSLAGVRAVGMEMGYELICVVSGNAIFVERHEFPRFGVVDNRPEVMMPPHSEMKLCQGYDGTLYLTGCREMLWKYQRRADGTIGCVQIEDDDLQVLPHGLRIFMPRLAYHGETLSRAAGGLVPERVPGNVLLRRRSRITSENGEDGILAHIFDLIGDGGRFCVDVGANDGRTFSNTWPLIADRGWGGIMVEADEAAFTRLAAEYADNPRVTSVQRHVTTVAPRRLDALLDEFGAPEMIDLLNIDIEGNDYHIWKSLSGARARVVVIDFNPSVANDVILVQRDSSVVNCGSSLRALCELAAEKGYELAAVTDWNAVFVLRELFGMLGVADNRIDQMYRPPFEMKLFQCMDGSLHLRGCRTLVRQDFEISEDDIQVIPSSLRIGLSGFAGFLKTPSIFYGDTRK